MSRLKKRRGNSAATKKNAFSVNAIMQHSDEETDAGQTRKTVVTKAQSSAYDENLLERTWTQWQFGDWESLTQLQREIIEDHPERAQLALLAAAGYLQSNNISGARQLIFLALEWGCSKKLISQILVAGVHVNLGRAAAITDQPLSSLQHFEKVISIGTPNSEARLLTYALINQQYAQLGLPTPQVNMSTNIIPATSFFLRDRRRFNPAVIAKVDLGNAWAGNTINTVIFRYHGVLSHGNYQTTSFFMDEHTLRLVQRDLTANAINTHDIVGSYQLRDAHNSISLGIDRLGYLHLSYDHHANQLHYRRSLEPHRIDNWTEELPMTGLAEGKVTYPTFISPFHGSPLTLLYRDGVHNKGVARFKTYNEEHQIWTDYPEPVLSGAEQKPWTCNAYWNSPAIGTDGSLHLSFVWRTDFLGEENRINNINLGYAYTLDNGFTWKASNNQPYKVPITPVNAEVIYRVTPGSNLINQTGMALDSRNRPHIVFYANDLNCIPQYHHLWFDGKQWKCQIISNRTQQFILQGGGTLQIPISRPEIVIDRQDNVYVIFRGDLSQNRLAVTLLPAPHYSWSEKNMRILWNEDVGFAEPVIDRERWARDNILTLLVQHNEQPNNDIGHNAVSHPICLLDINLNSV
jgi:hypothetical protein